MDESASIFILHVFAAGAHRQRMPSVPSLSPISYLSTPLLRWPFRAKTLPDRSTEDEAERGRRRGVRRAARYTFDIAAAVSSSCGVVATHGACDRSAHPRGRPFRYNLCTRVFLAATAWACESDSVVSVLFWDSSAVARSVMNPPVAYASMFSPEVGVSMRALIYDDAEGMENELHEELSVTVPRMKCCHFAFLASFAEFFLSAKLFFSPVSCSARKMLKGAALSAIVHHLSVRERSLLRCACQKLPSTGSLLGGHSVVLVFLLTVGS